MPLLEEKFSKIESEIKLEENYISNKTYKTLRKDESNYDLLEQYYHYDPLYVRQISHMSYKGNPYIQYNIGSYQISDDYDLSFIEELHSQIGTKELDKLLCILSTYAHFMSDKFHEGFHVSNKDKLTKAVKLICKDLPQRTASLNIDLVFNKQEAFNLIYNHAYEKFQDSLSIYKDYKHGTESRISRYICSGLLHVIAKAYKLAGNKCDHPYTYTKYVNEL